MSGAPRTLLLSASTGGGHLSAAHAVSAAFHTRGINAQVIDVLNLTPPVFRAWFLGGYETLVRYWPDLWGHLYRVSDRPRLTYHFQTALDLHYMTRLRAVMRRERPDWVVCTHSLPQPQLERLRRIAAPFNVAVVVTDYYPHRMWMRGYPDHYFVAGEWTRDVIARREPGADRRTTISGIPTDAAFFAPVSRPDARRALGADPATPSVLVTSGGIGAGPVTEAVGALAAAGVPCHITVLCGRNLAAHSHLSRMSEDLRGRGFRLQVEPLLPVAEVATRMHAADFVVGKPGGLTMSECMAAGVPMLIHRPLLIPGQEEGNRLFLEYVGAGATAADAESLTELTRGLLTDRDRLEEMRSRAQAAASPGAADTIAETVCRL